MKKINSLYGIYLIPLALYFIAFFYGIHGDVIFSWTMPTFYTSLGFSGILTLIGIYFFLKERKTILFFYMFIAFLPLLIFIIGKFIFYIKRF